MGHTRRLDTLQQAAQPLHGREGEGLLPAHAHPVDWGSDWQQAQPWSTSDPLMPAIGYSRCHVCHCPIPYTITSEPVPPGEPIVLVMDETDVWAHAWTHEEQADTDP